MKHLNPNSLWTDWAVKKCKSFLAANKVPFFSALGVGLLTYMFTLTNKLVNFDDVYCLFSRGGTLESGRWGLYLIWRFLPNLSMPWLHGIITLLFLSLSACIIVKTLQIRNAAVQGFTAALFVCFPSMIGIVTYMFDASAYAVSVYMAALSFSFGLRAAEAFTAASPILRRGTGWMLLSVSLCVLSLSIYQTFFMLISSLYLTVLLGKLLIQKEQTRCVVRKGLILLGNLLVSFLLYYLILRLFWWRHHYGGGSYMSSMTDTGTLSFPALLLRTYHLLPDAVLHGAYGLIVTKLSKLAHVLLFAYLGIRLVHLAVRTRRVSAILLAVLTALLLPVSVGAIILLSGDNVHSLVFFAFTSYYFLAGLLLEEQISSRGASVYSGIVCNGLTLVLLALVVNSVYVGNSAFLKLHMAYENSYAFYSSLVTQVKMLPELSPESKLAIIGKSEVFVNDFTQFPASDGIMGATGFEVNNYSYDRFIKNFVGFDIEFAAKDDVAAITASEQFAQMPVYPFEGSIQAFDDVVVVKLSEPDAS